MSEGKLRVISTTKVDVCAFGRLSTGIEPYLVIFYQGETETGIKIPRLPVDSHLSS